MATTPRAPLTQERILREAVVLADADGLERLTMRALGAALGVRAMSLYKHVADKDAILDGIVELVLREVDLPDVDAPWREALGARARSARRVLVAHSWAVGLLEGRGRSGSAQPRHADAVLGCLRAAGFGVEAAAHAFWLLDSFVYGHVVQEAAAGGGADEPGVATAEAAAPDALPWLAELQEHAAVAPDALGHDRVFEVGLGLVLDAMATLRDGPDPQAPQRAR